MSIQSINYLNSMPQQACRNIKYQTPIFRGNDNGTDTVELSTTQKKDKKGLSKGGKWTIGIGATLAGIATAGICIIKGHHNKLQKLYNEKLVPANLAEKIEFKEAKTLEEGIAFAQNVLGIKAVDKNFTVESINFVNKGLVDVSNAYKGKAYMPSALRFANHDKKNVVASMGLDINSNLGTLTIDKNYFDEGFLDKQLTRWFKPEKVEEGVGEKVKEEISEKAQKKIEKELKRGIDWSDRYRELRDKYKVDPKSLSLTEKRELYLRGTESVSNLASMDTNPLPFLKGAQEYFGELGIKYDYDELLDLPKDKLYDKYAEILDEHFRKTGTYTGIFDSYSPYGTIYHEMGHLQDYGLNLKEADLKQWNILKFRDGADEVGNRWLKRSDGKGKLEKLLKEKPEKFKKLYPEFYEFLTDKKTQRTAAEVSNYAMTGIGEFVAEVHKGLIQGDKFSDEVLALYKKYNGPMPVIH